MCPDFLLRLLCENLNVIPQDLGRKMKMKKVKVLSQSPSESDLHEFIPYKEIEMKVIYSFV